MSGFWVVDIKDEENLKRNKNKLRHELEIWRECVLSLYSLLKWEKNYYPLIIFFIITFDFLMIWLMQITALTFIALTLLSGVTLDYIYPLISKIINKPDNWTGEKEKIFEEIIHEIAYFIMWINKAFEYLFIRRHNKSTFCTISTATVLASIAYLGFIINNYVLTYLFTLFILLAPGLYHNKIYSLAKEYILQKLNRPTLKTE